MTFGDAEWLAGFDRQYREPRSGLHVCGFTEEENDYGPHVTLWSLPMDGAKARVIFDRMKERFGLPDEDNDYDVVVDLMTDGSCDDNFGMRLQMLEPMKREVLANA